MLRRSGASSAAKWPPRPNCILRAGSNSLEELALYIAVKGFDFQVLDPPELIPVLRALSERLRQAAAQRVTAR